MKFIRAIFAAVFLVVTLPAWADVSIVGTRTNIDSAGSCTAGAGSNRVVVLTVGAEPTATSSDLVVSALTYGTNSIANAQVVEAVTSVRGGSVERVRSAIYYIKEANILSGAQTVTVTFNQAITGTAKITCYTLSGVDQTTPVENTQSAGSIASSDPWTSSVTLANNSFAVLNAVANSNTVTATPDGAWTEDRDVDDGGARVVIQSKDTSTGGSTTWTVDWSGATGGTLAIASFGEVAASPPTFSVAPAIGTRTTSSIPVTATTACTDCNYYGVAVTDGSGAPTCTQIKAGQDSGGSAAYKAFGPVAMTTTVQNTGTFSTYTDGTIRDGYFCLNSTAGGDSTVSSIADMYKLPAFTTALTIASQTDTTYTTNSKVLDGPGTVDLVACAKDASPPSVSQVEARTGGCIINGSTDDATGTMTLDPSGAAFPVYDLYYVGSYGSQHEAAVHALVDECLDAPSGKTVVNCPNGLTSIGAGGAVEALNAVITPDLVAGDIPIVDSATTPEGCQVTMSVAGLISIAGPGGVGSCSGARQYVNATFYDLSAGAIHADDLDWWLNNLPPIAPTETLSLYVPLNSAMTPFDLTDSCPDPEGDAVTATLHSPDVLPLNLSIIANVVQGTAISRGKSTGIRIDCTDITGATTTW